MRALVCSFQFVLIAISFSTALAAQPPIPPVTSTDQAVRDQARLRILEEERTREMSALLQATQRRADRAGAGDAVGVAEAETAIHTHTDNLANLDREIGQSRPAGRSPARLPKSAARPAAQWVFPDSGNAGGPRPTAQAPTGGPVRTSGWLFPKDPEAAPGTRGSLQEP